MFRVEHIGSLPLRSHTPDANARYHNPLPQLARKTIQVFHVEHYPPRAV